MLVMLTNISNPSFKYHWLQKNFFITKEHTVVTCNSLPTSQSVCNL
uniref:Uncharacterized protein n=1 Tax=Anguilla anguilla TaxID=7936 RepID=A0A0E9QPK2_ANGAN